jgi:hypothetical protein
VQIKKCIKNRFFKTVPNAGNTAKKLKMKRKETKEIG